MIFRNLIQNVALLIAMAAFYQIIRNRLQRFDFPLHILSGILFGSVGILVMMNSYELSPGIIFDGRSIILGITGLYGGPVVAGISSVLCAGYRFWLGGDGVWVGVSTIIESAVIGSLFFYLRSRISRSFDIFLFTALGLVVHVCMLLSMLALPDGVGMDVIRQIGLPVILIYPMATVLVCLMFEDYEVQLRDRRDLINSENRFRMLAENAQDIVFRYEFTPRNRFSFISSSAVRITGYSREEFYNDAEIQKKLVHPDDRHLMKLLADGKINFSEPLNVRWLNKDGHIIWTEQRNTPFWDDNGKVIAVEGIIRDVSVNKAVEDALRENEEKYRLITENVTDVIMVLDREFSFSFISPSIENLLGYTPEEVADMCWMELLTPQSYDKVLHSMNIDVKNKRINVNEEQLKSIIELQVYHKNGSLLWVETALSIIHGGEVETDRVLAIIRNISERKTAEEKQKETHELLRYVIEHNRSGIVVFDHDLNFIYVSQQFLSDFHIHKKDVIGKNITQALPEIENTWMDIFHKTLAGNIIRGEDDILRRSNGTVDWVRWESHPWYDGEKEVGGLIFYTEIVTEKKQAEMDLLYSRDLLAKLTEQVPGMVYQFRIDSDGKMSMPYVSTGVVDLYELSPDEVMEKADLIFDRIHPSDLERVNRLIRISADTLDVFHVEFRVILPGQGLRWRLCDAKPERVPGGGILWNGIVTDISERKKTEQKVNEQLAELHRWNIAMLGRERRNLELKQEVNELLALLGRPSRYQHTEVIMEGADYHSELTSRLDQRYESEFGDEGEMQT